jgi:hypothetical protein
VWATREDTKPSPPPPPLPRVPCLAAAGGSRRGPCGDLGWRWRGLLRLGFSCAAPANRQGEVASCRRGLLPQGREIGWLWRWLRLPFCVKRRRRPDPLSMVGANAPSVGARCPSRSVLCHCCGLAQIYGGPENGRADGGCSVRGLLKALRGVGRGWDDDGLGDWGFF